MHSAIHLQEIEDILSLVAVRKQEMVVIVEQRDRAVLCAVELVVDHIVHSVVARLRRVVQCPLHAFCQNEFESKIGFAFADSDVVRFAHIVIFSVERMQI